MHIAHITEKAVQTSLKLRTGRTRPFEHFPFIPLIMVISLSIFIIRHVFDSQKMKTANQKFRSFVIYARCVYPVFMVNSIDFEREGPADWLSSVWRSAGRRSLRWPTSESSRFPTVRLLVPLIWTCHSSRINTRSTDWNSRFRCIANPLGVLNKDRNATKPNCPTNKRWKRIRCPVGCKQPY